MAQTAMADSEMPEGWGGGALLDGGLASLVGFNLRMANVALFRDWSAAMAELDLTQRQTATLFLIAANPGVPQVAIAAHLDADRATIMAMVDRLQTRGLITRERSKTDRRRQELFLTREGEAMMHAARARISAHEKRFTARLSAAEVASLTDLLARLRG